MLFRSWRITRLVQEGLMWISLGIWLSRLRWSNPSRMTTTIIQKISKDNHLELRATCPKAQELHLQNFQKKNQMSKCRYCNSSSYGHCSTSPTKKHEHIEDEKRCEFCGSSSYGHCSTSPFGKHRHGHGGNKCIWCGSTSTGHCSTSPNGVHEK